jgi:hypothetical protein
VQGAMLVRTVPSCKLQAMVFEKCITPIMLHAAAVWDAYLEQSCTCCCVEAICSCCLHQFLQLLQVQRLAQPLRVICRGTNGTAATTPCKMCLV